MCGKNIGGGSLLRAWCVLLVLLLVALLGGKVWPEESGPGSSESTAIESPTTSGKLAALKNAALLLKAELSELETDSLALSSQLATLQTEYDALKSSWTALLKLWTDSQDLLKAEREAAERNRQAILDRCLNAERNTRILGGVCIGTTVAGAIGWILWAVSR